MKLHVAMVLGLCTLSLASAQDRFPQLPADQMTDVQKKVVADIVAGPRGSFVGPFVPLLSGPAAQPSQPSQSAIQPRRSACPQLPTTLPTLDELIGVDGVTADNVHQALLARTASARSGHVFTLHAELEGMKLLPVFRRLIGGWHGQGYQLVSMRTLFAQLDLANLPSGRVQSGSVPGRSGSLAVQGPA